MDCAEVFAPRIGKMEALRGETVTVVGGTGFVGSWLAESIAYLNDRHNFGTRLAIVARNVEAFKAQRPHLVRPDFTFIASDVRYAFEIPKETNWLVHAAANPDTRFHASRPVETMTTIASGTETLLRASERCSKLKMFMNLSSGLVYGAQPLDLDRIPESYSAGHDVHSVSAAYVGAKRYSESLAQSFRSQNRLPVVVARPFAFVGPYQSLDNPWAITNFIQDGLSGRPIRALGDGTSVRSYMYPSDMAFWLLRILSYAETGTVYNVGSPEAVALGDLAVKVAREFEPSPEVRLSAGTLPQSQRSRLVPDTTLAREKMGLEITVPLDEALKRTVAWYRTAKV